MYTALVFFGAACAVVYVSGGEGESGVRAAIRLTARTTVLLLLVIFPASAMLRRWPGAATRWIVRNRRYLGLSLAVSHGYHALFIGWLYASGTAGDIPAATVYGGGLGFAFLAAMAATSNDASQRALGANWRRLHLAGIYWVWIVYVASYVPQAATNPFAALIGLGLIGTLALRHVPISTASADAA